MQTIENDIEGEPPPCEELPVEPAFTHFYECQLLSDIMVLR